MKNQPVPLSLLEQVVTRYREIVPDWSAFLSALQRPLPQCLWANSLRCDGDELFSLIQEAGMMPERLPWRVDAFRIHQPSSLAQQWWYLAGLAHCQEEVSQLPVQLMDLQPGMRVWDMCAAPGGKTAQIAMAMKNRGTVVANDIATGRLRSLSGNLERLGLLNVVTTRADAATYPHQAGQFDRVLLDAPCSGEGTLRKYPRHIERMGVNFSSQLSGLQKALLRRAIQLCKPGGRVVYSTCTFAPEENELVVAEILAEFDGEVTLLPASIDRLNSSPGITEWQGLCLPDTLSHCMRLWPQQNDSGGFFVAVLQKSSEKKSVDWEPAKLVNSENEWQENLNRVFDFPLSLWTQFQAHRQCKRGLHLTSADLQPPQLPKPQNQGALFYRPDTRPPRLTTIAAQLLGDYAGRNRLSLDHEQLDDYFQGKTFLLSESQRSLLEPGYQLIFFSGHCLGLGIYHRKSQTLQSQFPLKWCGRAAINVK